MMTVARDEMTARGWLKLQKGYSLVKDGYSLVKIYRIYRLMGKVECIINKGKRPEAAASGKSLRAVSEGTIKGSHSGQ
jgi:hypothetical protein